MRRRLPLVRRRTLVADENGATAVEFGLVALPFFAMLFAIFEVGIIFTLDSVLENATIQTGRLVRTGQASAENMTAEQFRTALCDRMSIFSSDCLERAKVDVRVLPQFNTEPPDPMAGGVFDDNALGYTNGEPGSIVLVRVFYRQPLLTNFLSQALSRLNDGAAILTATTAFRNEPGVWSPVAAQGAGG